MLTGYEKYQLEWMIEHGYSLEDLMRELEYYTDYISVIKLFRDWEGYGKYIVIVGV